MAKIHKRPAEVNRYCGLVQEQGDAQRDLLGFLPRSAYAEAAAQGKLYVATVDVAGQEYYAGHLLFGGKFPHLRVFQIYTMPQFRGRDIGQKLIEALVSEAEEQYYITISARVAADLPANVFWERMGFVEIRTVSGGVTTGRMINIRRRELNSPTLFSSPKGARAFSLPKHPKPEHPIFALDVNVLLDVLKNRPRGEYAKRLMTASMSGILRLFVAQEFVEELSRAAREQEPDPVLQLAMSLPQFTRVPALFLNSLRGQLAEIVFPSRAISGSLRERDRSDLTHLATMIYHKAAGFVTSDEWILGKRTALRDLYGIEVLGPAELAELYMPSQWTAAQALAESPDGVVIEVSELEEARRQEAESFLKTCSMTDRQAASAVEPGQSACPRHRVVVSVAGEIVGFAAWDASRGPKSSTVAWLGLDPDSSVGELACDVLLDTMFRDSCFARPACVVLNRGRANREAIEYARGQGFKGFTAPDGGTALHKYCLGKILTPASWGAARSELLDLFGFALPTSPPEYSGPDTAIAICMDGTSVQAISLQEFESHFGPAILVIPKRPVVVVPIQRPYADQLLDTAKQRPLFPAPEASVLGEKLYVSTPRALSVLVPGAVILFYESIGSNSGRGAAIAAAQITRTAVKENSEIGIETSRRGVLSSEEVRNMSSRNKVGLTFFNQLFRFECPVELSRLRELGCADGTNFVTARQIEEATGSIIIEEGKGSVRLS
ncbi:MAG TPA: GNAT family N-acetyltransferase [Edaphobacter sp.]|uniref:GNAT family N-acetyltransferase n=1 Tax=Edaphobacter sp. TaxID=1934404 RepID=UPI002B5A86FE|nr:GNAT family N-acetyltransferase [Edaphobacter sp.]HUZ96767.1 GNAT family N-acetyltransferase [Edaphobacter sp.]